MATLRLVPVSGPPIDVVKDQSMVGREPSCEIVVTDGSVSRRHARLERRGAAWWVVDQGSANGTYVNSLKVAEQALRNNQELRFGALVFRVELREDPEATIAAPIPKDDSATVMVPQSPPPASPPPIPPAPKPAGPPPLPPAAAAPPSAPPSAAAARERFRPQGPTSPVPQMPAGAPAAKKGRSPVLWILGGCAGCLLLVVLLVGAIGFGVMRAALPAREAAKAFAAEVREEDDAGAREMMSEAYRDRVAGDSEEYAAIASAIRSSENVTFLPFWNRSVTVDQDTTILRGILTNGRSRPIEFRLVKEGRTWKVDDVSLADR